MNNARVMLLTALLLAGHALKAADHEPAVEYSEAQRAAAVALRDQALGDETAWRLLESLTTEVGPRMHGSPGDARAVAWAERELESLGFDRIWREPVRAPRWVRGEESAAIVEPFPQPLVVTALGGSPGTPHGGLAAEVAHFATYEDLLAAGADQVAGKIVFISNRMARSRDGQGYVDAVIARSRGSMAAHERGGIALLIRSIGTDDDRLPHTGMMRLPEDDPTAVVPAAALSNPDADLLENALERGSVEVMLALDVGFDGEATSYNVIGEIHGRERPEEVVILGSHLDSWDLGTGALDDGTGNAITMAAAHLIGGMEQRPSRTLRVVLYANEEQGLYGAKQYVIDHQDELSRHLIGAESDFGGGPIWRIRSAVGEAGEPLVAQIAELLAPLDIAYDAESEAYGGADVGQLKLAGMPVIDLSQDGTDYFDLHHTANDTLAKVNPEHLRQNVAAWVVFAYLAADAPADFGRWVVTPE